MNQKLKALILDRDEMHMWLAYVDPGKAYIDVIVKCEVWLSNQTKTIHELIVQRPPHGHTSDGDVVFLIGQIEFDTFRFCQCCGTELYPEDLRIN